MNTKHIALGALALILGVSNAWAQDDPGGGEAEATIRLMGAAEAELPDAVTKEIALPESVSEDAAAVEKAQNGLANANQNRQRRGEGLARAEEAREKGAEMADEARENRENRGRSEEHIPDDRPAPPEPPRN